MGKTLDTLKGISVFGGLAMVMIGASVIGMTIGSAIGKVLVKKYFYKPQQGYVNPTEFEVKSEDRDEIKGNETYVNYKGKRYRFVEDEQGNPVAIPYVEEERK